jgi:hypothetical protein
MILSYSHRFIFLRPPKVGSTSVQQALAEHCRKGDWVSVVWGKPETIHARFAGAAVHGPIHFSEKVMRPPEMTSEAAQFSVAPRRRRPWPNTHALPEKIRGLNRRAWERFLRITIVRNPWAQMRSIERFMQMWDNPPAMDVERTGAMVQKFCNAANVVLRFENLEQDVEQLSERLGLKLQLPHLRNYGAEDYTEFFTDAEREKVATAFSGVIERFNYRFGG